mgnify:FL=1
MENWIGTLQPQQMSEPESSFATRQSSNIEVIPLDIVGFWDILQGKEFWILELLTHRIWNLG